jgi:hypothetical protein
MLETSEEKKKSAKRFNSCVIEVPKEFALANGLPEKSLVSLTFRNGKLESEIIVYSDRSEKEVEEFLADFPGFDEEMRKLGD